VLITLSACDIDGMISYLFISEQNVVFAKEYLRWTKKGFEKSQVNFKLIGCSLIISAARKMSCD